MILKKMLVAVLGVGLVVGCSTGQPVQGNSGNSMPSAIHMTEKAFISRRRISHGENSMRLQKSRYCRICLPLR